MEEDEYRIEVYFYISSINRYLVRDKTANLDFALAHEEAMYNNSIYRSTKKTPFGIFTRINPKGITELKDLFALR